MSDKEPIESIKYKTSFHDDPNLQRSHSQEELDDKSRKQDEYITEYFASLGIEKSDIQKALQDPNFKPSPQKVTKPKLRSKK